MWRVTVCLAVPLLVWAVPVPENDTRMTALMPQLFDHSGKQTQCKHTGCTGIPGECGHGCTCYQGLYCDAEIATSTELGLQYEQPNHTQAMLVTEAFASSCQRVGASETQHFICAGNCTAFDIYNKTLCNTWEANALPGGKPQCNIECDPRKI